MTRRLRLALALAALLPAAPALAQQGVPDAAWTGGDLVVTAPFARATLPGAPVAGGFLLIENRGGQDDRLLAAASPAAGRVELHEMAMEGDVMRMRELADGLPLPAGGTVALEPGGYHLMLMDLAAPLVEGDIVEVTLAFERAGEVVVPLAVGAPDAEGAQGHHHHDAASEDRP